MVPGSEPLAGDPGGGVVRSIGGREGRNGLPPNCPAPKVLRRGGRLRHLACPAAEAPPARSSNCGTASGPGIVPAREAHQRVDARVDRRMGREQVLEALARIVDAHLHHGGGRAFAARRGSRSCAAPRSWRRDSSSAPPRPRRRGIRAGATARSGSRPRGTRRARSARPRSRSRCRRRPCRGRCRRTSVRQLQRE